MSLRIAPVVSLYMFVSFLRFVVILSALLALVFAQILNDGCCFGRLIFTHAISPSKEYLRLGYAWLNTQEGQEVGRVDFERVSELLQILGFGLLADLASFQTGE